MNNFLSPSEIASSTVEVGVAKVRLGIGKLLVLGFMAGAFIAVGGLVDIRVTAGIPATFGTLKLFIGAAVFPVGLILCVIAGAELLTGNMMVLPLALHSKRIAGVKLIYNWVWVTIGNFIGSLFVAYVFGYMAKLLTAAPWSTATIALASDKVHLSYLATIASGIGCNWLVGLAVWMAIGAKDIIGKIFAIWFPIMTFVAVGFQHVVANMFFIPAAIFVHGPISWGSAFTELSAAFIGNAIGGWVFVAAVYWFVYLKSENAEKSVESVSV